MLVMLFRVNGLKAFILVWFPYVILRHVSGIKVTHTHTHTYKYIYIYIAVVEPLCDISNIILMSWVSRIRYIRCRPMTSIIV